MKFVLAVFFLLSIFPSLQSQESSYLIDSLHIKGNTRTKEYIITKELDFRTGDSLFLTAADQIFEKIKTDCLEQHFLSMQTSIFQRYL
ncbi:MAG: hypothetical protein IPH57_13330 [Saprospiraceae bacterium]|nr:hypothetical protein [Saprospiraceae bacterium]